MISGESRQVTWKMCYDRCDDAGLWGAWGDDAYRERAGRRLPSCVDATQSDERRRRPERPSFPVVEGDPVRARPWPHRENCPAAETSEYEEKVGALADDLGFRTRVGTSVGCP